MVMQDSAIVNTEIPPFSAPMIRLLTVEILSHVRMKNLFAVEMFFFYDKTTVARTQEVDVHTQLVSGVRLLQAQAHMCVSNVPHFFAHSSHAYILSGIATIFTSATPVSLNETMIYYER